MFLHLIGVLLLVGPAHSFQGCFPLEGWNSLPRNLQDRQNNRKCIEFCHERFHPLAATSGVNCVCMDSLPSTAHALASEGEKAAGRNSKCNMKCPGDAHSEEESCVSESCCGGSDDAFSVYATGNVDFVEKLMRNIMNKRDHVLRMLNINPEDAQFQAQVLFNVRMAGNDERQCLVNFAGGSGNHGVPTQICTDITEDRPGISGVPTIGLRVDNIEKEVSTSGDPQEVPVGENDVELNNINGRTEGKISTTREVSTTSGQTYSTESGSDHSFSIGASISTSFEAFGTEFAVELTSEYSYSKFYNYGYEEANETGITETFAIEIPVPIGVRTAVLFYKKFQDHTLKWRCTVYARDNIQLYNVYESGSQKEISLSELLTPQERSFHGFGTINGEARPIIAVIIRNYDATGNLMESRPATEEEAHAVSSTRKRDPAKPGDSKKGLKKLHKSSKRHH